MGPEIPSQFNQKKHLIICAKWNTAQNQGGARFTWQIDVRWAGNQVARNLPLHSGTPSECLVDAAIANWDSMSGNAGGHWELPALDSLSGLCGTNYGALGGLGFQQLSAKYLISMPAFCACFPPRSSRPERQ